MAFDMNNMLIWLHKHSQQVLCAALACISILLFIYSVNVFYKHIKNNNALVTLSPTNVGKINFDLNLDESAPADNVAVAQNAPAPGGVARLDLTLTGIISSTDRKFSQAIIVSNGGTRNYNQGEYIEGLQNVLVEKIDENTVDINNNGMRQHVVFLEDYESRSREILQPMEGNRHLSDFIVGNPVYVHDQLKGVRLNPRGSNDNFRRLGFQPADIAIKINNHVLTDAVEMKAALDALNSLGSAQFTVLRNNSEKLINASTMDVE